MVIVFVYYYFLRNFTCITIDFSLDWFAASLLFATLFLGLPLSWSPIALAFGALKRKHRTPRCLSNNVF